MTSGDGITLGESAGGRLDTDLASPVAWCPVSLVPYRNGRVGVYPHIVDRGKPGLIAVLADGRRFVNEADGYYDFVSGWSRPSRPASRSQAWLICDHTFQRRYPFGMSKPFPLPVWPYVRSGYLKRGAPSRSWPATAASTRSAWNRRSRSSTGTPALGEDPEFGRGTTPFNRGSGDPDHGPTRRWHRSSEGRSTRSRSCPAASAPSPG